MGSMPGCAAIETFTHGALILAIVLRSGFRRAGIEFFTPPEFSQQLAYMNRPAGYVIRPHLHNPVQRVVHETKEVLFVRSGRVRVDFYDDDRHFVSDTVLEAGDVILLASGGHGFEMLDACEIIEVKQGPYVGEGDKTLFDPL
jgi:mannose-6-phosphate isomerase-like protein (cupin superfamily)